MKSESWRIVDQHLTEFPILKATGVSKEEIDAASTNLGIEFPHDYREFLMRYGSAIIGPYPVFGLRALEPMGNRWSVKEVNKFYRTQKWPDVMNWLIISADHAGNPIGISTDGKVLLSDHGQVVQVAGDFEHFLLNFCLKLKS